MAEIGPQLSYIGHTLFNKWPWFFMNVYSHTTRFHPGFTDADPFKLVSVNYDRITHTSEKDGGDLYGRVINGTWDHPKSELAEYPLYRSLQEYIETDDPSSYIDAFEQRHRVARWNYTGAEAASDRLDDIDTLVHSLLTDGYLVQRELDGPEETMAGDYTADTPSVLNEVTVAIGRDGTLYYCWMGGAHRLFLAQILDVDFERIPVLVSVRHSEWQRVRNEIRSSDSVTAVPPECRDYLDHPDIQDIHPGHGR